MTGGKTPENRELQHLPYLIFFAILMYAAFDAGITWGFKPFVLSIIGYAAMFMIPAILMNMAVIGFVLWMLYILLS